MEKISFVIPCYRSSKTIKNVVSEITSAMQKIPEYDYEVILVNDSPQDNVWNVISEICEKDTHIIGCNLSKNFGQPSATMAGFSLVSGDYIITMDDDGQSPVDATPGIIKMLKEGNYDVVYGVCKQAKFGFFRRLGSYVNRLMASYAFNRPKEHRIISFCIYRRFVIEEMKNYKNMYTYLSGLTYRSTNNIGFYSVVHRERAEGKSGYSFKKLIKLWLNGLTAFSVKPLRIASYFGILLAAIGFIMGLVVAVSKLINPATAAGWSSIICLLLFLNGVSFVIMGLMGEYIGRIYMCINNSPQYVIREIIGEKFDNKR